MAHIRQSRPDAAFGFQVKVMNSFTFADLEVEGRGAGGVAVYLVERYTSSHPSIYLSIYLSIYVSIHI